MPSVEKPARVTPANEVMLPNATATTLSIRSQAPIFLPISPRGVICAFAMALLTLESARAALFKYASNVAYVDATASDKALFDAAINQVCERFIGNAKWRGTIVRGRFTVYDKQITLPRSIETILVGERVITATTDEENCGCGYGLSIFNGWYSISTDAVGNPSECCIPGLVDLGENWPGFRNPSGTFFIKATSELSEAGKTILLRGLDANGEAVYSGTNVEGVNLNIVSATPATTAQSFTKLDYWAKSAVTNGVVRLYFVDTTTAVATLFAVIAPGELTSSYRRYAVDAEDGDVVSALCKRAFFPAVSDNDPIVPSNMGALKLGLMALQYEDKNDFERSEDFWNRGFQILDADRAEFDGDSAIPIMRFIGDYGAGGIPSFI